MQSRSLSLTAAAILVVGLLAACQPKEAEMVEAETVEAMDPVEEFAGRYAAAWSGGDPTGPPAFFAEEGSLAVNDGEPAVGRQAIAEVAQGFMTDLPDMVVIFDRLEKVDGRILFHWTLEATNSGPGGTGNRVRVSGHESWRLDEDGLIAESQGHFPTEEYERQLEVGYEGSAPPEQGG